MTNARNIRQIPEQIRQTQVVQLQVAGQGGVSAAGRGKSSAEFIQFACPVKALGVELRVFVWQDETQIVMFNTITWQVVQRFTQTNIGINPDPGCQYWVSLDTNNRSISTGVGEIRKETETLSYRFKATVMKTRRLFTICFIALRASRYLLMKRRLMPVPSVFLSPSSCLWRLFRPISSQ